jgi:hypothetical protein
LFEREIEKRTGTPIPCARLLEKGARISQINPEGKMME